LNENLFFACTLQGNKNNNCGTGVAFTRNPANGENLFFGAYLVNAQGEDVVAGIRTPGDLENMKEHWPKIYEELVSIRDLLEKEYRDMQDIEFTIEDEILYDLPLQSSYFCFHTSSVMICFSNAFACIFFK
jgi:pyruvate,orthophosphate dikinase